MIWLVLLGAAMLAVGLALQWAAATKAHSLGVEGDVVYADDQGSEVLISERHGLVGKPDYIMREAGELVPVEQKSRALSAASPYEGELLQLAAYCVLVEEKFGVVVRRGRLIYANRSVDVEFDERLRARLAASLEAMRECEGQDVGRSHNSPARSRGCGFKLGCGQGIR